ncbi:MAG: hypothetical protein ACXW25_03840 [Rhodospirillales bacterium]|jgi:microcystin-dependent protein
MTQANDLANIQNQLAQPYRQRVNANLQAVVTQHYGATEPSPLYPNMLWFSSGDGYIKLRNPTNSGWQTVGTIGPPMKWTNVDVPSTGWRAGDIKATIRGEEAGWFVLNDGTIGDQYSGATTRPNPDCWEAFAYLWGAFGLPLYVAGTWTPVGRAADWVTDWNAHRHLQTPKVLGRAMASQGQGAGLAMRWWCAWDGEESVTLNGNQIPGHYHSFGVPAHGHPYCVDVASQNSYNSSGSGGFATGGNQKVVTGAYTGWPDAATDGAIIGGGGGFAGNTGWAGADQAHTNVGPRFYVNFLMKL